MAFKITATNTFREIFGGIDGGRILDVACGAGQFIEILQDSLKSWNEIFGMDVDAQYLNEARQKYPGDCYRFVVGNSEQIPYPANVFNLVSISKGLHHIKDPGLVLKEMKRVLIPGGYLVINEMYSDRLSESQNSQKLYHHLRAEVDNMLGIHHFYTLRKKEIIHFAESLKLTGILVYEYIENQDDPLNIDKIKEYSDKLKQTNETQIYEIPVMVQNKEEWHQVTLKLYENGPKVICQIKDITERKKILDDLRKSELKYHRLFDSIGDAIIVHDFEGNILSVNKEASRRFQYLEQELTNSTIFLLSNNAPKDESFERFALIKKEGGKTFVYVR